MKILEELHATIQTYVVKLEKHTDRIWYAPLIGILAALDNIIIIIPNDGILIASSMIAPKRWSIFAISVAIGSTVGAIALCLILKSQGLPWILNLYPGLDQSQAWILTERFFDQYGLIVVFIIGLSPLMQQPVVILAALAHTQLYALAAVIFAGRFIKYMLLAYIGSHSPKLLKKIWGIKDELKDAGIKIE
jgi:membrane protein YqaA with SNARE-associated domain